MLHGGWWWPYEDCEKSLTCILITGVFILGSTLSFNWPILGYGYHFLYEDQKTWINVCDVWRLIEISKYLYLLQNCRYCDQCSMTHMYGHLILVKIRSNQTALAKTAESNKAPKYNFGKNFSQVRKKLTHCLNLDALKHNQEKTMHNFVVPSQSFPV